MGLGTRADARSTSCCIWLYTLSCHSCRHTSAAGCGTSPSTRSATGSGPGSPSSTPTTRRYAWFSLFSVALVDLYIYLLATNVIDDPRFF